MIRRARYLRPVTLPLDRSYGPVTIMDGAGKVQRVIPVTDLQPADRCGQHGLIGCSRCKYTGRAMTIKSRRAFTK